MGTLLLADNKNIKISNVGTLGVVYQTSNEQCEIGTESERFRELCATHTHTHTHTHTSIYLSIYIYI